MKADKSSQPAAERSGSSLRVNAPDDAFEREADRAADAFARGTPLSGGVPFSVGRVSLLQRCGCGKKSAGSECDSCRKKRVQRRASSDAGADLAGTMAPPIVNDVLESSGQALDRGTRTRMETHFGADFGDVRLHTDEQASRSAAAVSAEAWTVGNHIAFANQAFNPRSPEGQRLLAHELSHVMQQGGGLRRRPAPPRGINPTVMDEYDEAKLWEGLKKEYRLRVETGELDDRDLTNSVITSRLDGLTSSEGTALIDKVKKHGEKNPKLSVAKVVEYLEVRQQVSTPMPSGSAVTRDAITNDVESYTTTLGRARVKVVADTAGNSRNETGPTTNFPLAFSWSADSKNIVTSLTTKVGGRDVPFNPFFFEVVIATKYSGNPNETSAYGRGTTAEDQENKATTLRVHEGSHGTDYISYIRTHPFPVDLSKGVVGVLTNSQLASVAKYIKDFFKDADTYSCEHTDQVGFTQKEFVKTPEGKRSGIVSCK